MGTIVITTRMLAEDIISSAATKWPEVFTEEFCEWAISKIPNDHSTAVYETRKVLLDYAQHQCGKCIACNLYINRYKEAVWSDGNIMSKIFVIGSGPSEFDQHTLIPFTSQNEFRASRCVMMCPNLRKCFPDEYIKQQRLLPHRGCDLPNYNSGQRIQAPELHSRLFAECKPEKITSKVDHLSDIINGAFWRESWNSIRQYQNKPDILSRLYFTNTTKCCNLIKGEGKTPLLSDSKLCQKWLDIQLQLVQPKVIITLGATAGKFVTKDKNFKMLEANGKFYVPTKAQLVGLPSSIRYIGHAIHPSYISMRPMEDKQKQELINDLTVIFTKAYIATVGKKEKQ